MPHDEIWRRIRIEATEAAEVTTSQLHGRPIPANTHEELWCLDTDNIPVDGEMSPMDAGEWGEVYEEVGTEMWPAICAWVLSGNYTAQGDGDLPVVGDYEERYCGEWDSFRDYAFQYVEDLDLFDGLPEDHVAVRYFNWGSWIRDLESDYTVMPTGHGGVYVFRSL